MKICVCVKQVPDPTLSMRVDPATKRLIRDPAKSILDPADEYAIETALKLVEQHGGETVAVTMGPEAAENALRQRALAMGIDRAIRITDDALAGSDAPGTARVLAAAIKAEQPDLIICATESTDAYSGMVPGALAAILDLPQVTFARSITVENGTLTAHADTESGYRVLQTALPALLTVTASIAEPRYPSFKGVMAAKRKQVDVKDAAALGLDGTTAGETGARERVLAVERVTQTKQTRKITDDGGDSVTEIVNFLKQIQVV
jgi:electron transfer flavoprotein beta subunit